MKLSRWPILLLLGLARAVAAGPEPAEPSGSSRWVFSLLPKSLQSKPSLDFHVITELTAEGRKLTPPTPQRPAYYIEQPGKFTQLGTNTPANEHPPVVAELEHAMQHALAASNYLAATPKTPIPRFAVVFNYGSFARFSTDLDDFRQMVALEELYQEAQNANPDAPTPGPFIPAGGERSAASLLPLVLANPPERKDILERAELTGGSKFAHDLGDVLDKEAVYEQASSGLGVPATADMSSPFNRFLNANDNLMSLVEESFSSCYFVVASAYDYPAMTKGKKVLLWRTKMTVNSIGISMTESLAPLIASAGPYLGRDMSEAATITRRITREGRVEIGTPTVVDENAASPPPAPPAEQTPKAPKP